MRSLGAGRRACPTILFLLALAVARDAGAFPGLLSHRLLLHSRLGLQDGWIVQIADMDRVVGGDDELVVAATTHAVIYKYDALHRFWGDGSLQVNFAEPGKLRVPVDVTGDGRPDLIVDTAMPDSSRWLACYDPARNHTADHRPIWRAGPFLENCRIGAQLEIGRVTMKGARDLDGDGRPELHVMEYPFNPGCMPRRLHAIDGPTGVEIWHADLAPPIEIAGVCVDPTRGWPQLIVTGYHACANAFLVDGEPDSQSCIAALDSDGRILWQTTVGGENSTAHALVTRLRGQGTQDIVLYARGAYALPGAPGDTSLFRVVPESGELRPVHQELPAPRQMIAHDIDSDGLPELLATCGRGGLYCLNSDLSLRWRITSSGVAFLAGAQDLDGDGLSEIVGYSEFAVTVLGANGRQLIQRELTGGTQMPQCALMRVGGKPRLLVRTGGDVQVFRLAGPVVPAWALPMLGVLMTGILLLAYLRARRGRGNSRDLDRLDEQERLLEAMKIFSHIGDGASYRILGYLMSLLKNWELHAVRPLSTRESFYEYIETFRESVLPQLTVVAARARRAQGSPGCWRSILPDAMAAEKALGVFAKAANAERATAGVVTGDPLPAPRVPGVDEAAIALGALESVSACLKALRAHLRTVHCAPVGIIARRVLQNRRDELIAGRIEAAVEVLCRPEPVAFISPSVLETIIDNMVGNAIRALEGRGRRRIDIVIQLDGIFCRLDVIDTGRGLALPQEQWSRVFDRDYTTRSAGPGWTVGGYGLYYTRTKIELYDGRIKVQCSVPGEGATFSLKLRMAEEVQGA